MKFDEGVSTDVLFFKIRERSILFGLNGKMPAFIKLLTILVFVLTASLIHSCIKSDGNRALPISLLFVRVYSAFKILGRNYTTFISEKLTFSIRLLMD